MKLKSAVFVNALKVAFKQLRTTMSAAEYQSIKVTAEAGNFVLFAEFIDNFTIKDGVGSNDGAVLSFFKTLTDNPAAAEQATLAFNKTLSETVNIADADQIVKSFSRPVSDTAFITDPVAKSFSTGFSDSTGISEDAALLAINKILSEVPSAADELNFLPFGKNPSDAPVATDEITSRSFTKLLTDIVDSTDDIDGSASTQDDQELQFAKVTTNIASLTDVLFLATTFNRAHADAFGVTDGDVLNFGKRPSETTSITDAGSLRNQGYSDFTYFQEDYVGASRTF
jgi:hypothetical protein